MSDDADRPILLPLESADLETLRTTREEARLVLDHQLRALTEIDRKAMRTVRIVVVLLGLVGSAATVGGAQSFINPLSVGGLLLLVVALVTGLVTYTASDPEAGISPRYLRDATEEPYDESEWLVLLLLGYGEWITTMETINADNARLLTWTQLLTAFGVLSLTAGTWLSLSTDPISMFPQVFT